MMSLQTTGIHHITAFARNPQENVDFYAGILGLRLVKKTINFDAPEVYHLYFGNKAGIPGTIITFFPWPTSRKGRVGGGQVGITTFVVPVGALSFWEDRLERFGISVTKAFRFSEQYLQFADKEGLRLEIVERAEGTNSEWSFSGVPADKAIKGFGGAVLFSIDPAKTMDALEHILGMKKVGEDQGYARFQTSADIGNLIDVPLSNMELGAGGAGTVHHIAWRARIMTSMYNGKTMCFYPVTNRLKLKTVSISMRFISAKPGESLFEIATDPPGFSRDEDAEFLGEKLMLPSWFEPRRAQLEANLHPIQVRELEEGRQ